ncbi:hypothetical protein HR09_08720 [Porphyromonas gulae]|uniref:hypothetical protein n=1 Tax=Porphyromonas gulae TaxID=111105 RepID=UPI00052CD109|nr:hypothetical protein [Porphyromonas gulae]KGN68233.1 hypothetical protein HR09_08720 [Porphyromonas gulae]
MFNQFAWELYKNSEQGKAVIREFSELVNDTRQWDTMKRYNPNFCKTQYQEDFDAILWTIYTTIEDYIEVPTSLREAKTAFEACIDYGVRDDDYYFVREKEYDFMIGCVVHYSFILYFIAGDFFFPYLFSYNIFPLVKLADYFGIKLPQVPKKTDYRGRCMYYWELCEIFYDFRMEYGLSTTELCAFLYDFSPKIIGRIKDEKMPTSSQVWCIGGAMNDFEQSQDMQMWQCNKETKRGDIILHYETSPISAITTIWRASTNGIIDPYFYYYSEIYIDNKLSVPPITLKEMRMDDYFKNHPLVRKNFQGVNGFSFSSQDYTELKKIWMQKGFDISLLPTLYAPDIALASNINKERDVEIVLLEPLLNEMGVEWVRQLPIHAGRGHRIYPDYALYADTTAGYEKAEILIEAKFLMKNNKDVEECFMQARSYANILEASIIIICDKNCLIIYRKHESFDRNRFMKIYWSELRQPDVYNKLKQIITK